METKVVQSASANTVAYLQKVVQEYFQDFPTAFK